MKSIHFKNKIALCGLLGAFCACVSWSQERNQDDRTADSIKGEKTERPTISKFDREKVLNTVIFESKLFEKQANIDLSKFAQNLKKTLHQNKVNCDVYVEVDLVGIKIKSLLRAPIGDEDAMGDNISLRDYIHVRKVRRHFLIDIQSDGIFLRAWQKEKAE